MLPDFSYLVSRPVRAIVLTHGHEDHVGGLPYVLREVEVERVIGTRLTLALVKSKLDEHGLGAATELIEVEPDGPAEQLGPFRLEFVRMAHSIPDSMAVVVETEAGRVLHTGDWKLDHTPGRRAEDRRRARSPSSATGASTSCSATPRTRSGRG